MHAVSASELALRFYGRFADPDEITRLIGAEPTSSGGEFWRTPLYGDPGVEYLHEGWWRLELPREAGGDVESQVAALLDSLNPEIEAWRSVTDRISGQIGIDVGLSTYNGGFELSAEIVRRIADRGLKIAFDAWAASGYPGEHRSAGDASAEDGS